MIFLASLFAAHEYGHDDHSFGYTHFNGHNGDPIEPLPTSLVEKASNIGVARLIMLCGSHLVHSLLAVRRSSEINYSHYLEEDLTFLGYDFETEAATNIVVTCATRRPKAGGSVVLDIPGSEVVWLQLSF